MKKSLKHTNSETKYKENLFILTKKRKIIQEKIKQKNIISDALKSAGTQRKQATIKIQLGGSGLANQSHDLNSEINNVFRKNQTLFFILILLNLLVLL